MGVPSEPRGRTGMTKLIAVFGYKWAHNGDGYTNIDSKTH